jgi:P4 family phage/plasmid primase-like protien
MNSLSNIEKLNQFLQNHYVDKDSKSITHTELHQGRYYISDTEHSIFFELYSKAVTDSNNLKIIERPKKLSPFKIDLDFRFDTDYTTHQYSETDVKNIVKAYLSEIDTYFDIDDASKAAFVYEIPKPVVEKKENKVDVYKDGIHIMFPFIITTKNIQHIIREKILLKFDDIFNKDTIKYVNSSKDIIDKAIIDSTGWLMYGSSKMNRDPYKLTKIYKPSSEYENIVDDDIDLIEDDIQKYDLKEIIQLSSIRNKDTESTITSDKITEVNEYGNKVNIKEINRDKKNYNKKTEDPNVINRYLEMLLPFRRDNYNSWLEIGLALYNIGDGGEDYLDLWDSFSQKSDKYEEGICKRKWGSFTKKDNLLNIGSIRYWAQIDNHYEYINYTYELGIFNEKIARCLDEPYDYDIAQVITNLYDEQFIYEPLNSEWYHFTEHRWKCIKREPLVLLNYISTDIVALFCKYFKRVLIPDWQSKDNLEDKINAAKNVDKIYKSIEKKCKDNKPKQAILNETKSGFKNEDFLRKIDLNKNLIGFNNGVYDLKNKYFRNGRPSDYITMSVNYDYVDYDKDNIIFQEVKDFIKSIQPDIVEDDTHRRKYLKQFLASIIQGVNTDESFHIFTGVGRNGKSKLVELLEMALGDYAGKLAISSLTKPRKNSSDASPDQVAIRNKRLVTMQESDPYDKINNGVLKEFSGGDKITGRGLYKDPITFKPQYKIIMICNDIPKLQSPTDTATFERLRVIEFPVHFTKEKKLIDRYEKPMDLTISDKIEIWGPYFMTLLIKWFNKYFPNTEVKLITPKIVNKYTNEYKNDNDKWNDFYQTDVELQNTKKDTDIINIRADIYNHFKQWCRDNELKLPGFLDEFKGDFQKRFKIPNDKIKNNKIIGWTIKYNVH